MIRKTISILCVACFAVPTADSQSRLHFRGVSSPECSRGESTPSTVLLFAAHDAPAPFYREVLPVSTPPRADLTLESVALPAAIEQAAELWVSIESGGIESPRRLMTLTRSATDLKTLVVNAAAASALRVVTVWKNYSGATDLFCPAGWVVLFASCNPGGTQINDKDTPLPPGMAWGARWNGWLLYSGGQPTGVHCQPVLGPYQAMARCAR